MGKRILVMSDSHGVNDTVQTILEREKPDMLIHCGDVEHGWDDIRRWAGAPLVPCLFVRGNCDWRPAKNVQEQAEIELYGHRILVVHGHHQSVNGGIGMLSYLAAREKCDLVFYGHTHQPADEEDRGIRFLNPGSVALPRGFSGPSYLVMELAEDGTYTVSFREAGTGKEFHL